MPHFRCDSLAFGASDPQWEKYIAQVGFKDLNCDEYPFKNTLEGLRVPAGTSQSVRSEQRKTRTRAMLLCRTQSRRRELFLGDDRIVVGALLGTGFEVGVEFGTQAPDLSA
ncbi:hypothetical protein GCM10009525_10500 [Streptosporangium amethystogenes subsp. fukuiense]